MADQLLLEVAVVVPKDRIPENRTMVEFSSATPMNSGVFGEKILYPSSVLCIPARSVIDRSGAPGLAM